MSSLTTRLRQAWLQAVENGCIISRFEAAVDDSEGKWKKGDRILYGVKLRDGEFTYYARNQTQNRDIQSVICEKRVGTVGYLCRLNGYRTLRPGAGKRKLGRQPDISPEVSTCRFYCQDSAQPLSLLNRAPLLRVPLAHYTWHAYYNAAPLDASGHVLWVPVEKNGLALKHWPQTLTAGFIKDAIALFNQLQDTLLFFNALHAGASVNHIHLQSVTHPTLLPGELAATVNYRGFDILQHYPAQAAVFDCTGPAQRIIDYVEQLQQRLIPFNLVMVSRSVLVFARDSNQTVVEEFPNDVLASLELCGLLTMASNADFQQVTSGKIAAALSRTTLPTTQIVDNIRG